jgi:hypothetical protein
MKEVVEQRVNTTAARGQLPVQHHHAPAAVPSSRVKKSKKSSLLFLDRYALPKRR